MSKKSSYIFRSFLIILLIIMAAFLVLYFASRPGAANDGKIKKPGIDEQIIAVSDYTYDGEKIGNIEKIVVHYVANPGSSAQANRNYFNSLASTHDRAASSHFIIGLDGEIIMCVPLDCVAFANGDSYVNRHAISIECCHPDASGKFNDSTLASLKALIEWLCDEYGLSNDDIIRHYDVTGKMCPLYFVEHKDEWEAFKSSIETK
ncbi:MAG: N-acetylmuramoyl-L-alanine amidase [Clostridiales bacterium]|nr:N-acetylmuramoyl-L-alanine amidase [Clostridiales bacterium]